MRYFITLAYDGTNYHGWQVQPNGVSVEEEVEKAISILLRHPIDIVGAGRTDAGVHATMMVAHLDLDEPIDEKQFAYRLNRILPPSISVNKVERVADEMHARFSARKRTYRYFVHTRKDPFLRYSSLELHYPLDFQAMNDAADELLKHSDFGAFCKSNSDAKTTLCHIYNAGWTRTSEYSWYFEITADRFLRNMVRAIVGTLLLVGRGLIDREGFRKVIETGNRQEAGESVPAHALFLHQIEY